LLWLSERPAFLQVGMIISGFCQEVFNELPLEFAAEVNQLMSLKLEGSVG